LYQWEKESVPVGIQRIQHRVNSLKKFANAGNAIFFRKRRRALI
jgi:hypothetical protein